MLLKDLAAAGGGQGTTTAGAQRRHRFARRLGVTVTMNDGSGLSRADRARPQQVVKLLDKMRGRSEFQALFNCPADRRTRRHARRSHAPQRRPQPLSRQDRHAVERQRAVRLLPGRAAAT